MVSVDEQDLRDSLVSSTSGHVLLPSPGHRLAFEQVGAGADAGPPDAGSQRGIPRHLFAMTTREARELLRQERRGLARVALEQRASSGGESADELGDGRLVLDPCLGRTELLCAKLGLCFVQLLGVCLGLAVAVGGARWLQRRVADGAVQTVEVTLVIGVAMPCVLLLFLSLLEHSEYCYVRKVSPQTQLRYTPVLHTLAPLLQRLVASLS